MKTKLILLLQVFFISTLMAQQIGSVHTYQKITSYTGGFNISLDIGDRFGSNLDTIGDLNNDGIMDIVVSAHRDDDGGTDRGAIYILFLDTNKSVKNYTKISSTSGNLGFALNDGACFGVGVCGLGDLDNDGVPDIAVGADGDTAGGTNTGALYILYMNTNGTVKSATKIGATTGYGTGGLPLISGDHFANGVDGIGDINGDGIPDLVVENWYDDGGGIRKGAIWVLTLLEQGTVNTYYKIYDGVPNFDAPIDNHDYFGSSVCGASDMNNDNIPDLVVGAYYDDDGGTDCGAAYVIYLNSNGSVKGYYKISNGNSGLASNAIATNAQFGTDLRTTVDIDGNGINDILVGGPRYGNDNGAIYIIGLNSNQTASVINIIDNSNFSQVTNGIRFGRSVAHIGDINNDGKVEIASGATYYNNNKGEIFIMSLNVAYSVTTSSTFSLCPGYCNGMAIASGVGGNPPYSYLWSTNSTNDTINNLCAGTYSVTITDASSITATSSTTIASYTPPNINLGNDTAIGINDSIILDAGAGFLSYIWSNNGYTQTQMIYGSSLGLGTFTFYVSVLDSNICQNSDTIVITVVTNPGIENQNSKNNISIYPNPTNESLYINFMNTNFKSGNIYIYDLQGKLIWNSTTKYLTNSPYKVDISNFPVGMYFLKIQSENYIVNRKFIID
ncbi:MAG: FG-GAP-like repeat-containing protein [Saprospiraceae bacterium]|nr:FG-GAP-like repeat-containing protein [Saprospiraceae bacterium]